MVLDGNSEKKDASKKQSMLSRIADMGWVDPYLTFENKQDPDPTLKKNLNSPKFIFVNKIESKVWFRGIFKSLWSNPNCG